MKEIPEAAARYAKARACPVCGQSQAQNLFRPKASPGWVGKCLNRGMVYVGVMEDTSALIFNGPVVYDQTDSKILTSSNLDDVKDSWEFELLPEKEAEWPALQRNAINVLQRIESFFGGASSDRRMLDLGSGWGYFLAVAKERGWITYGLEPLPASSVYARARFGLNIITDTLREDTFPPDSFDVVTSFQVFEHLPNPRENLQYLHRMLREGGLVVIEVPNFATWTMKIMRARHRHFVPDHLNFFSLDTLSQLLVNNGFSIVDCYFSTRYMSIRHMTRQWLRRYLPSLVVDPFEHLLQKTSLWERIIGLNIGDVITVIGRKHGNA